MSGRTPLPAPLDAAAAGRPTRFGPARELPPGLRERLRDCCDSVTDADAVRVEAGRDWWPLSTLWALEGQAPALPAVVARPVDAGQVAAVLAACSEAGVAVTPFAGASGVCGGSIPITGGVSLDLTGLDGLAGVDDESLLIDVRAGTFGDRLEEELRGRHSLTLGHWPQSIALSTVGGWVACRSAGQYSTRYGKIEDMVAGLEVALPDGRLIRTGGRAPRSAAGPDLTNLFVGSEGTLGVITEVRLRVHPAPPAERRAVYGFRSFPEGLDACRRILRRGAIPAVLRLYDRTESGRNFDQPGTCVLIVVDEGDPAIIDSAMSVVAAEAAASGAEVLDEALAARWLEHRNQVPAVDELIRGGLVVDTVEIAAYWKALPGVYDAAVSAVGALEGTLAVSAHQSHAYTDGACLYFTFAGRPGGGREEAESYYRRCFDAVTAASQGAGGTLSHHHGVGLNRARYLRSELGGGFEVLRSVKAALDPNSVLNPGKLGLPELAGGVP